MRIGYLDYQEIFTINTKYIMRFSIITLAGMALLAACGPSREKLKAEIEQAEQPMMSIQYDVDTIAANQLLDNYILFADRFPEDTLAPVYLFKAANLMIGIGCPEKSLDLFDRVISDYSNFSDLPLCYVFKGMALENTMRSDEATVVYQEFLQRFPDHFLAKDIKALLPLVEQGMNAEEQLTEITK